jgi:hypothetical protein
MYMSNLVASSMMADRMLCDAADGSDQRNAAVSGSLIVLLLIFWSRILNVPRNQRKNTNLISDRRA